MKTDYFDLHRKEKVFVFSVIIAWTILAVTTLARAEDSSTNRMLPVTVFGTNTVLVNVPADKEALIRKYLLLAQSYQEQRILRNLLVFDYTSLMKSHREVLDQMESLARKKDVANNVVSLGNVIAPDLGFELTYLRRIWGPLWAYGRIQTPVGGSAGIGLAW